MLKQDPCTHEALERRACVVKSNLIAEFQIWLTLKLKKNNKIVFKAIRQGVHTL